MSVAATEMRLDCSPSSWEHTLWECATFLPSLEILRPSETTHSPKRFSNSTRLNEGVDLIGRKLAEPTDFLLGVAVNPTAVDMREEWSRLEKKVEAGASFAFTQPLFDLQTLVDFLKRAEPLKLPIFLGILPLRSAKHAEFLHNEVPDISIPDEVRQRMYQAGERGAAAGVDIACEFLRVAKPLVQGIYLMPPFNKFEMAVKVIQGIELE